MQPLSLAAEIRIRAERRLGEMMAAQRDAGMMAQGGQPYQSTGSVSDPVGAPTLADAGIDKHLADRARKYAAIPEAEFNDNVTDWRGRVERENERVTVSLDTAASRHIYVAANSGNNEWYTPPEFVEAARSVLGKIDFDPASSAAANETVRAEAYMTADDDALTQPWPRPRSRTCVSATTSTARRVRQLAGAHWFLRRTRQIC